MKSKFTQLSISSHCAYFSLSTIFFCAGIASFTSASLNAADWAPAKGPLVTRWAKDVDPDHVLAEYPRPQLVRKTWQNLNGLWQYALTEKSVAKVTDWQGKILVPFPVESALSGVMQRVGQEKHLWYRRAFRVPADDAWKNKRLLLHFGAVDWEATVWVNGREAGSHRGGYDPFSLDITKHIVAGDSDQEIVVRVFDPTNSNWQPVGKQTNRPGGIWYTPSTGIWQTVWLEPVPEIFITGLKLTPDIDAGVLKIQVQSSTQAAKVRILVPDGVVYKKDLAPRDKPGPVLGMATGETNQEIQVELKKEVQLWRPDFPYCYDLEVSLEQEGKVVDTVNSYFGMRKIAVAKDAQGVNRLMLNNKPVFHFGPLDQGFWPDGLYTAPTDEALRFDIEFTKKMGFNTARKHVKVEPARWYYWCDKLGLMVWQDMPNGDRHTGGNKPDIVRSPESARNFESEWTAIIRAVENHPCIVMWVPFNEGWGQFDTARIVEFTRKLDPTRPVNNASGWADRGVGDVNDVHAYPGPAAPKNEEKRAAVLGEFGGLGLPLENHTWQAKNNWGYRSFKSRDELTLAYEQNVGKLPRLIAAGLSAAIYTQTTDVEVEVNGLLTYDRELIKADESRLIAANLAVYKPIPKTVVVVPSAREENAIAWKYTISPPADGWENPDFDAAAWKTGVAGFGTSNTPNTFPRTVWKTGDIWIRREFDLPDRKIETLRLLVHHDENAEIYLNGVLALKTQGFTQAYETFAISAEAQKTLKAGRNSIAVHCSQTFGGQYIDVGLVELQYEKE